MKQVAEGDISSVNNSPLRRYVKDYSLEFATSSGFKLGYKPSVLKVSEERVHRTKVHSL